MPHLRVISMKSLTEDDDKIMLLSSLVYGYSLGDKTWGRLMNHPTSVVLQRSNIILNRTVQRLSDRGS